MIHQNGSAQTLNLGAKSCRSGLPKWKSLHRSTESRAKKMKDLTHRNNKFAECSKTCRTCVGSPYVLLPWGTTQACCTVPSMRSQHSPIRERVGVAAGLGLGDGAMKSVSSTTGGGAMFSSTKTGLSMADVEGGSKGGCTFATGIPFGRHTRFAVKPLEAH